MSQDNIMVQCEEENCTDEATEAMATTTIGEEYIDIRWYCEPHVITYKNEFETVCYTCVRSLPNQDDY